MSNDVDAFVGAGLQHYAEAVRTTNRFVSELQSLLTAAMESEPERTAWQRKPGTELRKGSGTSGAPWINVAQQVQVADYPEVEAALVVGVWWRQEGTVVYTHFSGGPDHCKRFAKLEAPGIKWLKANTLHYFIRTPSEPVGLELDVRSLLDHVEKVVQDTAPPRGRASATSSTDNS